MHKKRLAAAAAVAAMTAVLSGTAGACGDKLVALGSCARRVHLTAC